MDSTVCPNHSHANVYDSVKSSDHPSPRMYPICSYFWSPHYFESHNFSCLLQMIFIFILFFKCHLGMSKFHGRIDHYKNIIILIFIKIIIYL